MLNRVYMGWRISRNLILCHFLKWIFNSCSRDCCIGGFSSLSVLKWITAGYHMCGIKEKSSCVVSTPAGCNCLLALPVTMYYTFTQTHFTFENGAPSSRNDTSQPSIENTPYLPRESHTFWWSFFQRPIIVGQCSICHHHGTNKLDNIGLK